MLRIRFLWIGRTQEAYLQEGLKIYQRRLQHYAHIVTEEIKPQRRWQSLPEITRKQIETKALRERLLPDEQSILLDEQGQQLDSVGLSRWLENFHLQSVPQITFMVGGPYGVDCEAFPQHTKRISLSPMTFSHQMVRLILLEQVYRAFTILSGEPYHHR
ncbi:MAG: 23S rRNA (pseudouridine(1915)-N(3))-methyltransferase RlmH [Deltaproteobacteria bacterium]|jgi:23S rRNA (pseudouridine1915-N3)-methyltransferase|nr:23S rRNA (pseudouridine(1915)-N(3))-methyltransferase RlmH [Deltaproteobacteria bacterium]MBT7204846.1 23S rRNA (pseudouridine(1915)-N(3))-methyltransferase RlmH [Deltaproteobacteria bacterium]